MKIYRIALDESLDEFLSWFDTSTEDINEKLKHRIIQPPNQKQETLMLYRGFNYLPEMINGKYVLSPANSEQKTLWFAHKLISQGLDPVDYASSHGKYLLEYPLNVIKHFQTVTYDNSDDSYAQIPEDILAKTNNMENCKYHYGYELPNGWYFSYKNEKFIICNHEITIFPSQVQELH